MNAHFDTNKYIMIPTVLDALHVEEEQAVLGPMADFSRLPGLKKDEDGNLQTINQHVPYLSEQVLEPAFRGQNRVLERGVHLHWAIPDALTRLRYHPHNDGTNQHDMMAVPNRWMVVRVHGGRVSKRWMIVSDYLWPDGENPGADQYVATFPKMKKAGGNFSGFSYLGHVQALEEHEVYSPPRGERLSKLTALGYGDPHYSAFYPNVQGVFGLCDSFEDPFWDNPSHTSDTVGYELFGWYENQDKDEYFKFVNSLPNNLNKTELHDKIKQVFGWTLPDTDLRERLPARMFCFAVLSINGDEMPDHPSAHPRDVKVAIGNTASEALSAFLAHQAVPEVEEPSGISVHPDDTHIGIGHSAIDTLSTSVTTQLISGVSGSQENIRRRRLQIENQLEAIQLNAKLHSETLDLGPKFEQARHQKSFSPVSGGHHWSIQRESMDDAGEIAPLDFHKDHSAFSALVLEKLENKLHRVNELQERYNKAKAGVESIQQLVCNHWHKYMICAYPPEEEANDYPNVDEARAHLEKLLILLELKQAYVGELRERADGDWTFSGGGVLEHLRTIAITDLRHLVPEAGMELDSDFMTWRYKVLNLELEERHILSIAQQLSAALNELRNGFTERDAFITRLKIMDIKPDESRSLTPMDYLTSMGRPGGFRIRIMTPTERAIVGDIATRLHILNQELQAQRHSLLGASSLDFSGWISLLQSDSDEVVLNTAAEIEGNWKSRVYDPVQALVHMPRLRLQRTPAPRFWQAKEPVLLLSGDGLAPSDRHGRDGALHPDGLLICQAFDGIELDVLSTQDEGAVDKLNQALISLNDNSSVFRVSNGNPWHPLFVEWEVRIDPIERGSNQRAAHRQFESDFIEKNYRLSETKSEFLKKQLGANIISGVSPIQGRGIMTPFAKERLIQEIENYLVIKIRQYLHHLMENGSVLAPNEKGFLNQVVEPKADKTFWINYLSGNQSNIFAYFDQIYHEQIGNAIHHDQAFPSSVSGLVHVIENISPFPFNLTQWVNDATNLLSDFQSMLSGNAVETAPIRVIWEVYERLFSTSSEIQTQPLNGFNQALLMKHQAWQLHIDDPLASGEAAALAARVKAAVGKQNHLASLPYQAFHPLRHGEMQIQRLRLIDNFGRVHKIIDLDNKGEEGPTPIVPDRMSGASRAGHLTLPARITQPARINFRWLSAENKQQESNSHPESSPICGWMIPNHLDRSLMFYDRTGGLMGYVNLKGDWRLPPGNTGAALIDDIPETHIRQIVRWLNKEAKRNEFREVFMDNFLNIVETAVENIDPDNAAQHQSMALLIGKAIAIVRASVDLQLKSWPAINQDWLNFQQSLSGETASSENFTSVKVPLRIGEHHQLNDGVVGYWREAEEGFIDDQFFTPQSHWTQLEDARIGLGNHLRTRFFETFPDEGEELWNKLVDRRWLHPVLYRPRHLLIDSQVPNDQADPLPDAVRNWIEEERVRLNVLHEGLTFSQAIDHSPQALTILMDPRALLHCTSGVLPTKALSIPKMYYDKALKQIQITFLTAPVLTNPGQINLLLPELAGGDWSWWQKDRQEWTQLSRTRIINQQELLGAFEEGDSLWSVLQSSGWLDINEDLSKGIIRKPSDRENHRLPSPWDTRQEEVEKTLDRLAHAIVPAHPDARFTTTQEIREGWMSLQMKAPEIL